MIKRDFVLLVSRKKRGRDELSDDVHHDDTVYLTYSRKRMKFGTLDEVRKVKKELEEQYPDAKYEVYKIQRWVEYKDSSGG